MDKIRLYDSYSEFTHAPHLWAVACLSILSFATACGSDSDKAGDEAQSSDQAAGQVNHEPLPAGTTPAALILNGDNAPAGYRYAEVRAIAIRTSEHRHEGITGGLASKNPISRVTENSCEHSTEGHYREIGSKKETQICRRKKMN